MTTCNGFLEFKKITNYFPICFIIWKMTLKSIQMCIFRVEREIEKALCGCDPCHSITAYGWGHASWHRGSIESKAQACWMAHYLYIYQGVLLILGASYTVMILACSQAVVPKTTGLQPVFRFSTFLSEGWYLKLNKDFWFCILVTQRSSDKGGPK